MTGAIFDKHARFLEALGCLEEPMAVFYTDKKPETGFSPEKCKLPTAKDEETGNVDFQELLETYCCGLRELRLARKKKTIAWFGPENFGCQGGAFSLGYVKPQIEMVACVISTGIPGIREGELYQESPQAVRYFFNTLDPRPAPAPYIVFKPFSQLAQDEEPELVAFFCRPEIASGLHQLAVFVTNDMEAVMSPFGAVCGNLVAWPLHYLARGKEKAVLGGWDPSGRKYMDVDEITFSMPFSLYRKMLDRWQESFITAMEWSIVKKRIAKSNKAWTKG